MFPTIFSIGNASLHSYGLLFAIGCLAGFFLTKAEAKRKNINPDRIADLIFYLLVAGIVGARIFYVFSDLSAYIENPLEFFKIWKGGLVFYGSLIFAFPTLFIYVKKHKMPLGKVLDIMAPAFVLAHFFGRIGCLLAGCCYGKPTNLPFAITFVNPESLAPLNVGLHPTQIYSALVNFTIFLFLWLVRKRIKIDGQLFWIYLLAYSVARSITELFRGDFRGEFILGVLSPAQFIGIIIAIASIVALTALRRRDSRES